ncbi:AAA family ATPase [Novosphingobium sp. ERW19]|uniref:AAA family ATPase n=1 Tax=Novosphingobium sp. ERW19 TaxID=2726186 RepID=UPI001456CD52|nr:AAA family ATPase [Novosphingobium sp. ERW19]NLR38800.1 AAA family ATPase [Novosphingobium sp. ERW19]
MQDEVSQTDPWIAFLSVEGLHNRLSFEINLHPGMNIIYGKNGIGKTTLLHIIANLSEADIERFRHLSFRRIEIKNSEGKSVRLEKVNGELSVFINDQKTSFDNETMALSEVEKESVRSVVGERATYLPAFRSVLERMRESNYNPYDERSKPEYEVLHHAEVEAFRLARNDKRIYRRDTASIESNVRKTLRCRQWFGSFVPVVRYPSIMDVVSGLSDEWGSAQVVIGNIDQKQFETAFVEIFSAIAEGSVSTGSQDQAKLLDEIKDLVALDDSRVQGPTRMSAYLQLVNIAEKNADSNQNYGNILEIYRKTLVDRKNGRERVLSPIKDFQDSVNVFLSEKEFKVGGRSTGMVPRLREDNVYIEPRSGKPYGVTALSSGERQIVTMLYSTSRSQFKAGCCLIDEPELSLHVDWQRIILKHIEKQHQGRQIIACTHSPEVGADHEGRVQFFSPRTVEADCEDSDSDEGVGV